MNFTKGVIFPAIAALSLIAAPMAIADDYPSKPITIVVPYPPGASTDTTARMIQAKMSEILGQPVVIENRGGSGGNVGAGYVARAKPDGYTLLFTVNPPVSLNKFVFKELGYDPAKDFTPIAELARTKIVLAAHPSMPFDTVAEMVAYAKENPGKLHFGSAGVGSAHQIAGETIKKNAGIDMVHIPYKGGGPAMQDLVGGHIELVFGTLPAALPQQEAGKIKILALAEQERSSELPDVPTVSETVEGVGIVTWLGLLGPAGLPDDIVAKLNEAANAAVADADVQDNMKGAGLEPVGGDAKAFNDLIQSDIVRFEELLPSIGIEPR